MEYNNNPGFESNVKGYQMSHEGRSIIDTVHVPCLNSTFFLCHETCWGLSGGVHREAVIFQQYKEESPIEVERRLITHQFDRKLDNIGLWSKNKINVSIYIRLEEMTALEIDQRAPFDSNKKLNYTGKRKLVKKYTAYVKVMLSKNKKTPTSLVAYWKEREVKGYAKTHWLTGWEKPPENWVLCEYRAITEDLTVLPESEFQKLLNGFGFGKIKFKYIYDWIGK